MSCWHSLQQFCPGCPVSFSSCVLEWSLPFPQLPPSYPLSGVLSSPSPLRPQLLGQLTTDIEPPHGWWDKNAASRVPSHCPWCLSPGGSGWGLRTGWASRNPAAVPCLEDACALGQMLQDPGQFPLCPTLTNHSVDAST